MFLGGCQSREEKLESHWQRAREHLSQQSWDAARIELLNVIKLAPDAAEARFQLAEAELELAKTGAMSPVEALLQYREAVRLDPDQIEYRARLGLMELGARDAEAAQVHAEFILAREPENVEAWLIRAQAHALRGESDPQLVALAKAAELAPERGSIQLLLAQAHERRGELDAAERALDRLLELEPTTASRLHLAMLLARTERTDRAREVLEQAVEAAQSVEERLEARSRLANLYIAADRLDEAESVMLAALSEDPESLSLLSQLTRFYALRGQAPRAEEMLHRQAALDPDARAPFLALAQLYERLGNRDRALATLDRVIEQEPRDERALMLRAQVLLTFAGAAPPGQASADREAARELVRQVLARNPASTPGLFTEAKFLLAEGDPRGAIERLQRVLEVESTPGALALSAAAYEQAGDLIRARQQLQEALQADPRDPRLAADLARLELRAGELDKAFERAQGVLRRSPESVTATLVEAGVWVERGEQTQARGALERILSETGVGRAADASARLQAADLALRIGETELGRRELERRLDLVSSDARALRILVGRLGRAEPELAAGRLARALEERPDFVAGLALRGELALDELSRAPKPEPDRLEGAQRDFQRVIELCRTGRGTAAECGDEAKRRVHLGLAKLFRLEGNPDRALAAYGEARDSGASSAWIELERASYLTELSRDQEATRAYERVLELDPRNGLALNNLAWGIAQRADAAAPELERASGYARRAVEAEPEVAAFADTLGYVLLEQGYPIAAAAAFKDAIRLAQTPSERAEMRFHLARAYDREGNVAAARSEVKRALAESKEFPSRALASELAARLAR